MAAAIITLRPLTRQQGIQIPGIVSPSQWVDALLLTSNTASAYILPTDSSGNKGTIIGVTATVGPLWVQAGGTASAPSSSTSNGSASSLLRTDDGFSYLIQVDEVTSVSFLSPSGSGTVSIEVWK